MRFTLNDSYDSGVPQLYGIHGRDDIANPTATCDIDSQTLEIRFDYDWGGFTTTNVIFTLRDSYDVSLATTGKITLVHLKNVYEVRELIGYDSVLTLNGETKTLSWHFSKSDLEQLSYVQFHVQSMN